jgi:hypothetical protein
MKQLSFFILLFIPLSIGVSAVPVQDEGPTHATFSTFTTGRHSGHILKVEKITTSGLCATVHFIEMVTPGGHRQALVDYEEHISIPILNESFEYVDAVNQFGDSVAALFDWQGKIYESTPCPIVYVVAPPTILLYKVPGANPLINTSNRAHITPTDPAIAGFVLNESSWVIIRGIGPSLETETGSISDPLLTLHADQYLLDDLNDDLENSISNDNWQDTLRIDSLAYWQLEPINPQEAALVTYLNPGAYTAHLNSKTGSGSGIVEVYVAPYVLLPE